MKSILVPIPEHHPVESVLDGAIAIARIFGGCVEGMAIAPDLSRTIAAEFPIDPHYIDPENRRQIVADAHDAFLRHMRDKQIEPYDPKSNHPGHSWTNWELGEDGRVAAHARLFDLVALARPVQSRDGPRIATIETVLFESGRPVLLVPPMTGREIGRRVVIAWNGSTETARTIAFAMPILMQAEQVTVLAIEGWDVDGPTGADLTMRLSRHGMNVDFVSRPHEGGAGEAIMRHSRELRADLLVKGAYTQSRLRQMIFGGATSHLLSHTDIPMFIAH
jgi:nucleotide-binding universal stress UspA family protein